MTKIKVPGFKSNEYGQSYYAVDKSGRLASVGDKARPTILKRWRFDLTDREIEDNGLAMLIRPSIPKVVDEYIKRWKAEFLTEPLFAVFLTIQHNINCDNPPDVEAENWIIDHSDTFARAWLMWPNVETTA